MESELHDAEAAVEEAIAGTGGGLAQSTLSELTLAARDAVEWLETHAFGQPGAAPAPESLLTKLTVVRAALEKADQVIAPTAQDAVKEEEAKMREEPTTDDDDMVEACRLSEQTEVEAKRRRVASAAQDRIATERMAAQQEQHLRQQALEQQLRNAQQQQGQQQDRQPATPSPASPVEVNTVSPTQPFLDAQPRLTPASQVWDEQQGCSSPMRTGGTKTPDANMMPPSPTLSEKELAATQRVINLEKRTSRSRSPHGADEAAEASWEAATAPKQE